MIIPAMPRRCASPSRAKQIIFFTAAGLLAVTADQGKEFWRVPWHTDYDCNICTPLLIGKDLLFVCSGEGMAVPCSSWSAAAPEIAWESKGNKSVMMNYWANAVVLQRLSLRHLRRIQREEDGPQLRRCQNGQIDVVQKNIGKAAVTLADGHLWISTKKGDLVLVQAKPTKFEEKGRITLLAEGCRTMPTIAEKRLYVRDRQDIYCLDIAGK